MKKLLMVLVILLATTINCFAGNSVWIQQDNQDSDGSVYIKQDGTGNKVGISTSAPFTINGENLTLIIKQIGNTNTTDLSTHIEFYGENMTVDYYVKGDSNKLRLEGDTDSTGHWYDFDVTGDSNTVRVDNYDSDNTLKTNIDLDIVGDSNDFWLKSRGDGHFIYVLMSGDSNRVHFYTHTDSAGMNTNSNKSIGPNVASHGQFADTSGSEGATLDAYIIGNSNQLDSSSYGTGNYQVHDIIGNSNIIDLHASHSGDYDLATIKGNNNYLKTVINGNNNTLRIHQEGGSNTARIYVYTSNAAVNMAQTGGSNTSNITVSGDSIYDYTLNFTQDGSYNCTYSYNRNNQTADVTATVANGC